MSVLGTRNAAGCVGESGRAFMYHTACKDTIQVLASETAEAMLSV